MESDSSDCEDVATVPFSLRLAAKELAEIRAEAKRLGMSANSYFRYGAKLARDRIESTLKYVHVLDEGVADAIETTVADVAKRRNFPAGVPRKVPQSKKRDEISA